MTECSIRVICRFRPLNQREIAAGGHVQYLEFDNNSVTISYSNKKEQFNFDKIFGGEEAKAASEGKVVQGCTQLEVWKEVEVGVVEVTKGFQATIFAYGQTGAGKSFSMFGTDLVSENRGIIPRACQMIFDYIHADTDNTTFQVKCSFLEIYKEIVFDLLEPTGTNLKVRETPQRGVWVDGLSERYASSIEEVMSLLQLGEKHRAKTATNMNAESSRSHSLFTITLIQRAQDGTEKIGKLNLADLAGSEKISKTGATGNTLEEAKKINQSLSALGNCINALTSSVGKKAVFIPYRDSKLTHILKDSLGGNSKTSLIIACSPHYSNVDENVSTLRFGQRAKTIKNKVTAKIHRSVEELQAIISKLQKQLAYLRAYVKQLEEVIQTQAPGVDVSLIRNDIKAASGGGGGLLGNGDATDTQQQQQEEVSTGDNVTTEDVGNDLQVAEMQIEIDKLKEQYQFTLSSLNEQLQESQQIKQQSESAIEEVKLLLEQERKKNTIEVNEFMAQQVVERAQRQDLEKQLYQVSIELETLKQQNTNREPESSYIRPNEPIIIAGALANPNNTPIPNSPRSSEMLRNLPSNMDPAAALVIENLSQKLREKIMLVSTLETEIVRLKELDANQAELLEKSKRNPINYSQEQQITRLEIDLEGKVRLIQLQENRCRQLQAQADAHAKELQQIQQEKTDAEAANIETLEEVMRLRQELARRDKEAAAKDKKPEVKIIKPISQPRTFSTFMGIGNRKKRELLPKRYTIKLPSKEGYLFKQGGFVRSWKRRWFVLKSDPPALYYYEKDGVPDPIGSIPLENCILQIADNETKRSNTFAIYHETERTFYLQATSATELRDWMAVINRVVAPETNVSNLLQTKVGVS